MNKPLFRPAIIIPVYNHEHAIAEVVQKILAFKHPILLVDDGSHAACQQALEHLQKQFEPTVSLLRLPENGGKGAAVKAGMRQLMAEGYSHALQLDADGQHCIEDISIFLQTAYQNTEKLVTGYPEYDESVPKLRFYARYLTHIWIWINTLSFSIIDSMCGFRVYPLQKAINVLDNGHCGNRMDFDSEIIVRWVWHGYEVINLPTRVQYPIDGVSHFKLLQDNVLITWMHTRLFFGMLWRSPRLIWRKLKKVSA